MSPRGRPPKAKQLELPTLENQNSETGEGTMEIKHVFRGINKKNMFGTEQDYPAQVIEDYLSQTYFVNGWKLFDVVVVRNTQDNIDMMYILIKE